MLEYDDKTHEYKVDGVIVPSVTQLLPKQNFHVSDEILNNLSIEGSTNHEMLRIYHESGNTMEDPYLIEFDSFIKENTVKFEKLLAYEKPLFSKKLKFAGTPDMIFKNSIVDLKRSRGNKKYHSLQLAGYNILAHENGFPKTKNQYIMYMDNGKFKLVNVYNEMAEDIFISLVKKYYIENVVNLYLK
jgi:CRISPR/Cas system-associated exonuclease Cas4 (RecB family)